MTKKKSKFTKMKMCKFCYCYVISVRSSTSFICIYHRETDISSFCLGEHWDNLLNNELAVLKH